MIPIPPIPTDEPFVPSLDLTVEPAHLQVTPAPARPDVTRPDPGAEQAREAAFESAFQWNGQPLQGFAIDRYCAFLSQRAAMGAPSMRASIGDGYTFYPDAIRILWLCSVKTSTIEQLRSDPEEMERTIQAWAAVSAPPPKVESAVTVALGIWNAANENHPEVRQHSSAAAGRGTDSGN